MAHLKADKPNQVWSWDITYRLTTGRSVWLYLLLVGNGWNRKVVAGDMAGVESVEIGTDLVPRDYIKVRICRPSGFANHQCHHPLLMLHAVKGNF